MPTLSRPVRVKRTISRPDSDRSNFEQGQDRRVIELRGWEADWARRDKEIDEALHSQGWWQRMVRNDPQFIGTKPEEVHFHSLEGVKSGVEMTPVAAAAKYLFPSNQDVLEQMTPEERGNMIWRDTFGTLLWKGIPALGKGGWAGAKKLWRFFKPKVKVLEFVPVEDAVTKVMTTGGRWNGFDYEESLRKFFKGHGFAKDEGEVLIRILQGEDPVALKALQYEKGLAKQEMSAGWKKNIVTEKTPYGGPQLSQEMKLATERATMESKHWGKLYRFNLRYKAKGPVTHANNILKEQVKRFYGEGVAKGVDITSLSEKEASNFVAQMLSPEGIGFITRAQTLGAGRYLIPWIRPERNVWGAGELLYGTKSRIYDRVVMMKSNSQRYVIDRMVMLGKMLEERGFGKLLTDKFGGVRFKPDTKLYNQRTTQAAYEFLSKADDVITSATKEGTRKALEGARDAVLKLKAQAGADSPAVAGLIETIYSYQDSLYKEMLTQYVPRILERYPLSDKGRALVQNMMSYWGPKVEQGFSSQAAWTYDARTKLVKGFLGDFRKLLGEQGEGLLLSKGKRAQAQLMKLNQALEYGKKFPAYLESYFPRIAERGANLEAKWTQSLTGINVSSGFMKGRVAQEGIGRVKDLATLIESRTKAQAKQLYFYEGMNQVVEYAKTLPAKWQQHTEFLISRALGRPSVLDDKLAQVLTNLPFTKGWDAYRMMNAAQTLNSFAYSGLLGVRPFATARNFMQPLVTVPTELGKGYSTGTVLRGMAKGVQKETRDYLKSIGAIGEYIPEQQFKPFLPRYGGWQKYNDFKDAMMWTFKMSDRYTRYWSGAAALNTWEGAIAETIGKLSPAVQMESRSVREFSKALGLQNQESWFRNEIETMLHLGKFEEAKAAYVKEIIANTQFLYGALDMPAATGYGGAMKSLTMFQSWWMNYASLLEKWAMTGQASDKVKKLLDYMISTAAAEQLLEAGSDRRTAIETVGAGPLPLQGEGFLPPVLEPGAKLLKSLYALHSAGWDKYNRDDLLEQAWEEALNAGEAAGTTYFPGGLQIKQLIKGYDQDRWRGVFDALTKYKRTEQFEPIYKKIPGRD